MKLFLYSALLSVLAGAGSCSPPTFPAPSTNIQVRCHIETLSGSAVGCQLRLDPNRIGYSYTAEVFTVGSPGSTTPIWSSTQAFAYTPWFSFPVEVPTTGTYVVKITADGYPCEQCCQADCGSGNVNGGHPVLEGKSTIVVSQNPSPTNFPINFDTRLCNALNCCN